MASLLAAGCLAVTTATAQTKTPEDSANPLPHVLARGTVGKINDELWAKMRGRSWYAGRGCPKRAKLRVLTIPFIDFAGKAQTGRMIVAAAVADDVLDVFAELYRAGFPIARMQLLHTYNGDDRKSMRANNTSAFNCRMKSGGGRLSMHAYGRAIDINPVQNPYLRGGRVQPAAGRGYARRGKSVAGRPGVIRRGGLVVKTFRRIGWRWGGNWRTVKDYQHFSQSRK